MVEETLLFLSAAATVVVVVVGFVQPDCSSGDCRRREMCADRPWAESRGERNDDRLRIVDAPLGSNIAFLCNYCGERDKGQARFWYTSHRMVYSNGTTKGRKEVVLGMSDPIESNRVYMTPDHRLVVRNLTSSDTGRYSCSGLGTDERVEFALDLLPANDVAAVTDDSMTGWTQYESRYLAPVAKVFPRVWKMDVDWDAWGPCDGCAGKRYRRAACRVRFDGQSGIRMACRSIGLPAAVMSVSLGLAAKLSKVPDFLLAETCYAYCQLSNRRGLPKYRNTFVLEEGSSLTLVCAEATADKKVTWRKDGLILTETESTADDTSGALLDAFGTLYLVRLAGDDSGNYTCYVDGDRTQEVLLAVRKSSLLSSKAYARHLYYLYYVFAMYFVVFGARIYYAYLNRREFLKITDSDVLKPEIPTVYLGRKIRIR